MPINWNSFTEFGVSHIPCGSLSEKESSADHGLGLPANTSILGGSSTVSFTGDDVLKPDINTDRWCMNLVCKLTYPTNGETRTIFGSPGSTLHIYVTNTNDPSPEVEYTYELGLGNANDIFLRQRYTSTGSQYVIIRAWFEGRYYDELNDAVSFAEHRFEAKELESNGYVTMGNFSGDVVNVGNYAYTGDAALINCNPLYVEFSQNFLEDSEYGNIDSRNYFQAWMFCAGSGNEVHTATSFPNVKTITSPSWVSTTDYPARGFFRHCVEDSTTAGLFWPPDVLNPGGYPAAPSGVVYGTPTAEAEEIVTLSGVGVETPNGFIKALAFPTQLDEFYTSSSSLINENFNIGFFSGGIWTKDDTDGQLFDPNEQYIMDDSITEYYVNTVEFDETRNFGAQFDPHNLVQINGGRLYGINGNGRSLGVTLKTLSLPSFGRDESIRRFDTLIVGPVSLENINQTSNDAVLRVTFDTVNAGELFPAGTAMSFPLTYYSNGQQEKGIFICKFPKPVDVSAFTLSFMGDITDYLYLSQLMIGNRIPIRCPDIGTYAFYSDESEWSKLADGTRRVVNRQPVLELFTSWTYISGQEPRDILSLQKTVGRRRLLFMEMFNSDNPVSTESYYKGLFQMKEWTPVENIGVDLWQGSITFAESITKENDVV